MKKALTFIVLLAFIFMGYTYIQKRSIEENEADFYPSAPTPYDEQQDIEFTPLTEDNNLHEDNDEVFFDELTEEYMQNKQSAYAKVISLDENLLQLQVYLSDFDTMVLQEDTIDFSLKTKNITLGITSETQLEANNIEDIKVGDIIYFDTQQSIYNSDTHIATSLRPFHVQQIKNILIQEVSNFD